MSAGGAGSSGPLPTPSLDAAGLPFSGKCTAPPPGSTQGRERSPACCAPPAAGAQEALELRERDFGSYELQSCANYERVWAEDAQDPSRQPPGEHGLAGAHCPPVLQRRLREGRAVLSRAWPARCVAGRRQARAVNVYSAGCDRRGSSARSCRCTKAPHAQCLCRPWLPARLQAAGRACEKWRSACGRS